MAIITHDFGTDRILDGMIHDGQTLRLHYKNGKIIDYEDVPDHLADGLIKAEIPARFILMQIRTPDRQSIQVGADDPFYWSN